MKVLFHTVLVTWFLAGWVHALFLDSAIVAYRVANGLIVVDGKPDLVWKELGAKPQSTSRIRLDDRRNVVLLADRNRLPDAQYAVPDSGSVTMLAAYDQEFLYFLFIVRESRTYNPVGAGCSLPNLWKANAVQVFVDPSAWSETLYSAYFSADAGQASYGTSIKTFEAAMPAWPGEARRYYRDRTDSNTFKLRSQPPARMQMASASRLASDTLTLGVEIRIPIAAAEYQDGKSLFVSWGYNHYPGPGNSCDALPIAYRWARHVKSYAGVDPKPPGWNPGDSVHFDPLASYDGWGRMQLAGNPPLNGSGCRQPPADADWDLAVWWAHCANVPVSIGWPSGPGPSPASGSGVASQFRDIRGRWIGQGRFLRIFPATQPRAERTPWSPALRAPAE